MKVPLLATDRTASGDLLIVANGECKYTPRPFLPYVYIPADSELPHKSEKIQHFQFMETGEPIDLMKFEFDSQKEATQFYRQCRSVDPRVLGMRFIEQVFIDQPDFFMQFPNTDKLKVMSFDIEVMTYGTGMFPTPKNSPIIAIGCQVLGRDPVVFMNYDKKRQDYDILAEFLEYIREVDPDVLAGYNSKSFDLPYIWDRVQIVNKKRNIPEPLSIGKMSRTKSDIKFETYQGDVWDLGGRIHFDILDEVWKDQKLFGIKNRKLKTVAKHFNIDVVELDDEVANLQALVNSDRLHEYVRSDAVATIGLVKVYLPNLVSLAEFMRVPLNSCIDTYNSFPSKLFHARKLTEMGLYPQLANLERYKADIEIDKDSGLKYEGAVVKINNSCAVCGDRIIYNRCCKCGRTFEDEEGKPPGRIENTHKVDFAGMYPHVIMTCNLSPETTRIVAFRDYVPEFRFSREKDALWVQIPDANFNKSIIIRIDMTREGFLPRELQWMKQERIRLKKEKAAAPEKQKKRYETQQYAYKVIMNIAYGYNGLTHCRFGDLSVAIATVGFARWMTMNVENWLGRSVVEIDTDGLVLDNWKPGREEKLNNALAVLIERVLGVKSHMELEYENLGTSYFYRAKNYVLKSPEGKITYHGVSFKSSRHSQTYDRALGLVAEAVLDGRKDMWPVIKDALDLTGLGIRDFVMRTKISKSIDSYEGENCLPVQLARQCQEVEGYIPTVGTQIEYVVAKEEPRYRLLSQVKDTSEIDYSYYLEDVHKVLALFNLSVPEPIDPLMLQMLEEGDDDG